MSERFNSPMSVDEKRFDSPMSADEKRWRRRSLYGLIVLLPLLVAVSGYGDIADWWTGKDRFAQEVAVDGNADFGGAQWQLSKFRMLPVPPNRDIPENAMAVLAEFEVQIHDKDLATNWLGCAISLEDENGRRWSTTDALPLPRTDAARSCKETIFLMAEKPSETVRVREAFLAPRETAQGLKVTVTLPTQRPNYLRFMQPPQLVEPK